MWCEKRMNHSQKDHPQRHVDDSGDSSSSGGARGALEALPLGPSRLIDVHVAVDQAGHHQQTAKIRHLQRGGTVT